MGGVQFSNFFCDDWGLGRYLGKFSPNFIHVHIYVCIYMCASGRVRIQLSQVARQDRAVVYRGHVSRVLRVRDM